MHYTIGLVLRVSFHLLVPMVVLAGCSTLMMNQEQALRDHVAKNHEDAIERIDRWLMLRKQLRHASVVSELDKVRLANDFFSALPWRADADSWDREDYWATPLETLVNNGGDCEDLAIAKYFTLLAGGIDADRLRLTYVWQLGFSDNRSQAHMVLAYFPDPGSEPLILDNLDEELLALSARADLEAVYSFNDSKLWLAEDLLQPVKVDSQVRLEKWRGVNQRMLNEAEQQYWFL
jgi:predicted transglutaminase-like cysteine proteinase